ncbi:hypothetical protein [Haloplanus pelagicus]|jgi:hypothetical protein|uniref:hypothetical protein n=1 Tax=Haloplanus pelagicus TaxID=2949995 RepID=UPI003CE546A8
MLLSQKQFVPECQRPTVPLSYREVMSESEDTATKPQISVAVVDESHTNEIPDNIDSELYTTTRPESSMVEFTADPDGELVAALRRNGFDV